VITLVPTRLVRHARHVSHVRIAVLLVGLGCGALMSCFAVPSDDVLFSCEFEGDDSCPPDYRCEVDNCCHRIGSDVEATLGSCALGGNSSGMTGTDGTADTSGTDTSSESGSDSGSESG
jgi:hypothetical protein